MKAMGSEGDWGASIELILPYTRNDRGCSVPMKYRTGSSRLRVLEINDPQHIGPSTGDCKSRIKSHCLRIEIPHEGWLAHSEVL